MGNTIAQKTIGVAGQIVLAWLLAPADFGLVGLAFSVVTFVNLIRQAGISQVLVHRDQHFRRWANAAFWMSLALGFVAGGVMAAVAPLAARIFHAPEVKGLIWVLAAGSPILALATVPQARLQSQMRFGFLTIAGVFTALLSMGLSIALAYFGYGAYSFVWPVVIVGAVRVALYWLAEPPPIFWNPHLRRWKYLVGDSGMLFLTSLFYTVVAQGDYFILGLLHPKEVVGAYYFAFTLSMQMVLLLSLNLSQVLFPALSKLQDEPHRQMRAFVRAARQLAMLGVPICLLQAALANPGIHVLFAPKWYPTIPLLEVLSVATAIRLMGLPASMAITAQGRFRIGAWLALINSVVFVGMTLTAAILGGALSVAVAVALFYVIMDNVNIWVVIRPGGGTLKNVWEIYAVPVSVSLIAVGAAWAAGNAVPDIRGQNWIKIAVMTLVTATIYIPMIRWLAPQLWKEFVERLKAVNPLSADVSTMPA